MSSLTPTRTPAVIGLAPQARAGDAAGTLLIDSWMINLLRVKPGELETYAQVSVWRVPTGETGHLADM